MEIKKMLKLSYEEKVRIVDDDWMKVNIFLLWLSKQELAEYQAIRQKNR